MRTNFNRHKQAQSHMQWKSAKWHAIESAIARHCGLSNVPFLMTLNDLQLQGHFTYCEVFKCDFSYDCAATTSVANRDDNFADYRYNGPHSSKLPLLISWFSIKHRTSPCPYIACYADIRDCNRTAAYRIAVKGFMELRRLGRNQTALLQIKLYLQKAKEDRWNKRIRNGNWPADVWTARRTVLCRSWDDRSAWLPWDRWRYCVRTFAGNVPHRCTATAKLLTCKPLRLNLMSSINQSIEFVESAPLV